ncbi:hypothetical protein FQA39_LY12158 [Lamprigera yunnana]|nr:hypothetical protein FQA39_LY12158 [Lamprigera yunnana]
MPEAENNDAKDPNCEDYSGSSSNDGDDNTEDDADDIVKPTFDSMSSYVAPSGLFGISRTSKTQPHNIIQFTCLNVGEYSKIGIKPHIAIEGPSYKNYSSSESDPFGADNDSDYVPDDPLQVTGVLNVDNQENDKTPQEIPNQEATDNQDLWTQTNAEVNSVRTKFKEPFPTYTNDLNDDELKGFISFLFFSRVMKSNHEDGCGLDARRMFACGECRDPAGVLSTFEKLGRRPAESYRVLDSNSGNVGPPTGLELPDSKQAVSTEAPGALVEQYLNSGRRGHSEKSQVA